MSLRLLLTQEYERIVQKGDCHPDVYVNLGCTYFFLGMYPEADESAMKGLFSLFEIDSLAELRLDDN